MKHNRRKLIGLTLVLLASCGSAPSIREYRIEPPKQGGYLRAEKEQFDKPLQWCNEVGCTAVSDEDLKKIKKYILKLEARLKQCESR